MLAMRVLEDRDLTSRDLYVVSTIKKIMFKLESGESPLILNSVSAYKDSSRVAGRGTVKIIREVLRELGVDVSSGYRKIATLRRKI